MENEQFRIGTVTDTNNTKHQARVKYQDTGITSGWLYVLQHPSAALSISSVSGHTHVTDGKGSSTNGEHSHSGTAGVWMPKINDTVLVAYLSPTGDADGFILGVIV
jgi:phage baseplate assembly protein gpV